MKRNPTCGCGEEAICNEAELVCHPCCRCIPKRLCATFISQGCECDGTSELLLVDEHAEYVGSIACAQSVADLLVHIIEENGVCYWRVVSEALQVDQRFVIGASGQSCEQPELSIAVTFNLCVGNIQIRRYDLAILEPRVTYCDEQPWCDSCECVCKTLCIWRFDGTGYKLEELPWDPYRRAWGNVLLDRDQATGGCVAIVPGFDPIPVNSCGTDLSFYAKGPAGEITAQCKACTCGKMCSGCCFPFGYDPYMGWYPKDINFSIVAPNCSDLNGHSDFFSATAINDKKRGHCGVCGTYKAWGTVQTLGKGHFVRDGICTETPCGVMFCFALECPESEPTLYPEDCCNKVRLILGVSEKFVGTKPAPELFPSQPCKYYIRIAPLSCVCNADGTLSAIFPLDNLALQCADIIPSGPCYGQPACCLPIVCALGGARLVI